MVEKEVGVEVWKVKFSIYAGHLLKKGVYVVGKNEIRNGSDFGTVAYLTFFFSFL